MPWDTIWEVVGRRSWVAFGAIALLWLLLAAGVPATWLWIGTGIIVVLSLAWWIWASRRADRLLDEMRAFARDHGWELRAYSSAIDHRFTGYPFSGASKSWREGILEGRYAGRRCGTFTHIAEQRDPDGNLVSRLAFQVTFAELEVALPRVDIVPESFANRLAQALGGVDVEMESHEFNERWRVICDDRRYATDVIDPRMMQRLIAPDTPDFPLRIEGGAVMMWAPGRHGVSDFSRQLDVLVGVANRIPAHVLRHYRDQGRGRAGAVDDLGWGQRPGMRVVDDGEGLTGPTWATRGGILNSGHYTGIDTDAAGDDTDGAAWPGR